MTPDIIIDIKDIVQRCIKWTVACFILMTLFFTGCEQPNMIPDFGSIQDTEEKKMLFFSFMTPLITAENNRILRDRKKLLRLHELYLDKSRLPRADVRWVKKLASEYDADGDGQEIPWRILLRRVDIVPLELALIQSAKESGWGTSRFAREGYNMFGEYCYRKGCGIVPEQRDPGRKHKVAAFRSVTESVRSYINNLNTHDAYLEFRTLRSLMRKEGKPFDSKSLAGALPMYSERREHYIAEVQHMLQKNAHLIPN